MCLPICGFLEAYAVSTRRSALIPRSFWNAACSGSDRWRSRSISSVVNVSLPDDLLTRLE